MDDEGRRGVYDVLKEDTKAPPLCGRFVFSNKDSAAGVREGVRSALPLFLALVLDDEDDASLFRFAINTSALFAADSLLLISGMRKEGWRSIVASFPDKMRGVAATHPHVIMGDSFPAPGIIWGVMAT